MPIVTEAEFMKLPETKLRTELIEGEVVVSPSPTNVHQFIVLEVAVALRQWAAREVFAGGNYSVAIAPLDVKFRTNRVLQPDVMVFSPGLKRNVEMPIEQVPLVCIEVMSSSRMKDLVTNRAIYSDAGVAEYWVVDPEQKNASRYTLPMAVGHIFGGAMKSLALPGFALQLGPLFGEDEEG